MNKELLSPLPVELQQAILSEFITPGNHDLADPVNVANRVTREPLFIVAGVQILDGVIHNDAEIPENRSLVFQPSVRLKFLPTIAANPGTFSSFVNIASLAVNRPHEEHEEVTEDWLNFLNKLKIPNISTSRRATQSDWGRGEFQNEVFDIYSGETHIGDAVFRTGIPQDSRQSINISDISFGYERLLLVLGIVSEIFDLNARSQMDLERTLTLILGSGILPGNKLNIGRKIQSLIKQLDYSTLNHDAISKFHEWWSQFTYLPLKPYRIYDIISETKFRSC